MKRYSYGLTKTAAWAHASVISARQRIFCGRMYLCMWASHVAHDCKSMWFVNYVTLKQADLPSLHLFSCPAKHGNKGTLYSVCSELN